MAVIVGSFAQFGAIDGLQLEKKAGGAGARVQGFDLNSLLYVFSCDS